MLKYTLTSSALAVVLMTGCASTPESMSQVEELQQQYQHLAASSDANEYAPVKLNEAERSLNTLNTLIEKDADDVKVNHQIYLTERKLDSVEATIASKKSEMVIANADSTRKDILLDARTREAELANAKAERLSAEAEAAENYAEMMAAQAKELQQTVTDLTAKETERGLVLSLNNILFEVNKAELKPGAERTIQKVSEFLNEYPNRNIIVEGFTDSTGDDDYNLMLSERRAEAVKRALQQYEVSSSRVQTQGYGESYPVASNDTSSGRLQNRRVEIIIANQGEVVQQRR